MSPRSKAPGSTRPQTPSGLGLGSTNIAAGKRSVSSSSSTSVRGVAPCFHTNRPQFISSHIDRCEACRLKYARQAEQTTIPYQPAARRTSGVQQQQRSLSRQSASARRPGSSASVGAPASPMGATTGQSRQQDGARPAHSRSSSAGAPMLEARANTRRAIARAAEEALGAQAPSLALPPARGDAGSSSSDAPPSPTETIASRSRSRPPAQRPKGGAREQLLSSARGLTHRQRRTGSESPVSFIRAGKAPGAAQAGLGGEDAQAIDLTNALMGSLVDRTRDYDKAIEKKEAEIAQLKSENRRLRQQAPRAQGEPGEPANMFDPNSASARQKAAEQTTELDRAALDRFDDFRRAYEDCEPSLRSNRAQFAGERPLSPPPAALTKSALAAAEVRRAGEDLMSTPVRRTGRTLRGTSTRRVRAARPLFSGESELSDDSSGDEGDEHATLRHCLMSASNFGTFLVQYVTRQCLELSTLGDENKELVQRAEELERRAALMEKQTRRLEEARDEHAAQTYDMSVRQDQLRDQAEASERSARRMGAENEKLRLELAAANERGQSLDEQVARLNAQLGKARQRYEQEASGMRRSANALQQEKAQLARKNDELRVELKGKLQRAGLKANVDEYLAGRRREQGGVQDPQPAQQDARGEIDAAADSEIKRLQETVQFWRKKTDRISRKLRAEKGAGKEAQRMLRVQQEETARYQQAYGPLPDDAAADGMESLGAYLGSRRGSVLTVASASRNSDSDSGSDSDLRGSLRSGSASSDGESAAREAEEAADDQDIRRYEQRMRSRRALQATPRRTPRAPAPARRVLAVDVGAGESLGEILGSGSQWAEPGSAPRSRAGTARGVLPPEAASLAAELGALDALDAQPSPPVMARSLSGASPRPRTRSFRGGLPPFGDSSPGFGIGFDASMNLAEQFAAAARRPSATVGRPQTADVSITTDPLPGSANAQTVAAAASGDASVYAEVPRPSAEAAAATAYTSAVRSVAVAPLVSASAHAESAVQAGGATGDQGVQAAAGVASQGCATDPRIGSAQRGAVAVPAAVSRLVQAEPAVVSVGAVTEMSAGSARCAGVDAVALASAFSVQAAPEVGAVAVATDPRMGVAHASACAVAAQRSQAVATDRMEGVAHAAVAAVPAARSAGVVAGSQALADAAVGTSNPALVERGSDAAALPTADAGTSAQTVQTSDTQAATDEAMLGAWLSPLIPAGISLATALAALARTGRPLHDILAEQAAEEARVRELTAADEAAASAKLLVSRGTDPVLSTSEFAVQVEPRLASKLQQAGMATADTGVDAAAGPVLASVAVATVARPVDRWVEPFDPVARAHKSVAAVAATAARATAQDVASQCAAVDAASESREAAVVAVAESAVAATAMDIGLADRAAGPDVELRDLGVQAGVSQTAAVGTSAAAPVADRAAEPLFARADCATSCITASCERGVAAGAGATQIAGTSTAVAVVDASVGMAASSSDATVVTDAPKSRGVATEALQVAAAADAAMQVGSQTANAGVAARPRSQATAVGTDTDTVVSVFTQTVESERPLPARRAASPFAARIGAAASSVESLGSDVGTVPVSGHSFQSTVPRSRPPVPALPSIGKARSAQSPSPRLPAHGLPTYSMSLPGSRGDSAVDLINQPLSNRDNAAPVSGGLASPQRESDHEDYGYIMVSPRTHVQRVPVSALSSSRASSLAKPPSRDDSSSYAISRQLSNMSCENGKPAASIGSRGLGCDDDGNEDAAASDADEASLAAAAPMGFSTTRAIALQTDDSGVPQPRPSMSIGVEANLQQQDQPLAARQPEPLIVQSIARAMVGAYMWKYTPTRFSHTAGRERRHLRYFWIHPYAKLLNWSKQPPSGGVGMARSNRDHGGRSVYIREVRIVEEPRAHGDAAEPAYCIVVSTDHREIKLKATTQSDHDLWFMAMSYLQSRRIITSTTYPTASAAAGYQSDDSLHSRATSLASMDSSQRVIMQVDRRQRREQSRSRSRSKSRPALGSLLGRPPLPPPVPQRPQSSSVGSVATNDGSLPASNASRSSCNLDQPGGRALSPPHPHRSTIDATPSRVHSLQSTPRSLRPVSMLPAVTPGSEANKRLSIGLFRKMGGSSTTSLFRHSTHASEDASPPALPVSADQPLSIASMMSGPAHESPRGTVRKMFSGSFLKALRSRESVVDDE